MLLFFVTMYRNNKKKNNVVEKIMEWPYNLHFYNKYLSKARFSNRSTVKRQFVQMSTIGWGYLIERKHGFDKRTVNWNNTENRKLIQKGIHRGNLEKDLSYSQSAVSKIWCEYKRSEIVKKEKHTGRPWKTSKSLERSLKIICLENWKCTVN